MNQIKIGPNSFEVPAEIESFAAGVAWLKQSADTQNDGESPEDHAARKAIAADLSAQGEAAIEAAKTPAPPATPPVAAPKKGSK